MGNGVYEINTHDLLPTLAGFAGASETRPKIFRVLVQRIRERLGELTLDELCELSVILRSFEGSFEGVYETMEPYLVSKIYSFTEDNLVSALYGFYNPHLSKRFPLLDLLE